MDVLIPSSRPVDRGKYIGLDIITAGFNVSPAVNRNFCLNKATSDIVILLRDDVSLFFDGWQKALIDPLTKDDHCILASARMLYFNGLPQADYPNDCDYVKVEGAGVPLDAVAFRLDDTRFDEEYNGLCDADFCNQLLAKYKLGHFAVVNTCKLISRVVPQWLPGDREYFEKKWRANVSQ